MNHFEPETWHYSCGLGSSGPQTTALACVPHYPSLFPAEKPPAVCPEIGPWTHSTLLILANSRRWVWASLPSLRVHGWGWASPLRDKHLRMRPMRWGPVVLPFRVGWRFLTKTTTDDKTTLRVPVQVSECVLERRDVILRNAKWWAEINGSDRWMDPKASLAFGTDWRVFMGNFEICF